MRITVLFTVSTIAHGTGSGELVLVAKMKVARNLGLPALGLQCTRDVLGEAD